MVAVGDLLREEMKSSSDLGKDIRVNLRNGNIFDPDLISKLLINRFFDDSSKKILVNYPINTVQAESLARYISSKALQLDACVVVNDSKESVIEKFSSQFHCENSLHPKLESSEISPRCNVCGKPMIHTYNLYDDKVAHLVDSYFNKGGALSGSYFLSNCLGTESISYTTPMLVATQLKNLVHEK